MKPSQSRLGKNGEEHYRSETRPNASYSVKISLKIATRLKPCHPLVDLGSRDVSGSFPSLQLSTSRQVDTPQVDTLCAGVLR